MLCNILGIRSDQIGVYSGSATVATIDLRRRWVVWSLDSGFSHIFSLCHLD